MDEKITILIADDHPIARSGIRSALESAPDMLIVGEAQDGNEAQKLMAELRPDILLLDLKMPGLSAFEIHEWARAHYPKTVTIILTAHDRDFYLAGMMEAGTAGFLTKSERAEDLITGIRRAAHGERLFTQEQIDRVLRWRADAGRKWESLTEGERGILKLLTEGSSNADIAKAIGITSKTVAYHITNILEKLEVHSRQEAAAWSHKYLPDNLE